MRNRGTTANSRDRGLTLVELLVVIGILVVVTAATLPMIKPVLKDRKVREASRQLNSFISLAQAYAGENGRSAGVYFERSASNPNACFDIYLAEEPPPYSGDHFGQRCLASIGDAGNDGLSEYADFEQAHNGQFALAISSPNLSLVHEGDEIQFDFKGPRYVIERIAYVDPMNPSTSDIRVFFYHREATWNTSTWELSTTPIVPPRSGSRLRYQVFRQPIKSNKRTLTLPNGICIDLSLSGVGLPQANQDPTSSGYDFIYQTTSTASPTRYAALIMFSPDGRLESFTRMKNTGTVFVNQSSPCGATVYLLVGRTEQIGDPGGYPAVDFRDSSISSTYSNPRIQVTKNVTDNSNLWVTVGHRTGQINTSENGWPLLASEMTGSENFVDLMIAAREFARRGNAAGGQ